MIDNPEKTASLMAKIREALPIQANVTRYLKNALAEKTPKISVPDQCDIVDIVYTGDMGGILCSLKVGGADSEASVIVSITHLVFGRNISLAREIEAYQKHRVKKLKQQ
ncbi:MAG: hypothetical protein V1721_05325 [Pseudomonadota bacterium]